MHHRNDHSCKNEYECEVACFWIWLPVCALPVSFNFFGHMTVVPCKE
uniref:Uncharacterized protein n=1 Tax=Anguilla anguilla TaxID=7936 RepID=A0A0E9VNM1_ANGAN